MFEFLKTSPLKAAGALASSVTAIFGALWMLDSHYAAAADVEAVKRTFTTQMIQNRVDDLDDRIFLLQLKKNQQNGKLDPVDSTMLERYIRKQQILQKDIESIKDEKK